MPSIATPNVLMEGFSTPCEDSSSGESSPPSTSEEEGHSSPINQKEVRISAPPPTEPPSSTVVTVSCAEDNCPVCDEDIDALPVFLNEYARSHQRCLVCKETLASDWTTPSFDMVKVLKEICIKSILPEVTVQGGVLDPSYPFCESCTLDKINTLSTLYRQLVELQEAYDAVRFAIVGPIMTSFVEERKGSSHKVPATHGERDGDKLFGYWKANLSYTVREEEEEPIPADDEVEIGIPPSVGVVQGVENPKVVTGSWASVGVGTDPAFNLSPNWNMEIPLTSQEELRIKSEPLETEGGGDNELASRENYGFINHKELLPVVALEDLTAQQTARPPEDVEINAAPQPILPTILQNSESEEPSKSNNTRQNQNVPTISNLLSTLGVEENVQLPVIYTATETEETDPHPSKREESSPSQKLTNGAIRLIRQNLGIIPASQIKLSSKLALNCKRKAILTLARNPRSEINERERMKLITLHLQQRLQHSPPLPHKRIEGNKNKRVQVSQSSGDSGSGSGSSSEEEEDSTNGLNFSEQLPLTSSESIDVNGRRLRARPLKIAMNTPPPSGIRRSLRQLQTESQRRDRPRRILIRNSPPPENKKRRRTPPPPPKQTESQVKRGRGRPHKMDENGNRIVAPPHAPTSNSGRGRGRPRKVLNNSDQESSSDEDDLELLKCTPSIIEGSQDVQIPFLQEEEEEELPRGRKSRRRPAKKGRQRSPSPLNTFTDEDGVEYFEVAPPTPTDCPSDENQEQEKEERKVSNNVAEEEESGKEEDEVNEESERVKRRFATDSPPRKRIKRKRSSPLPTNRPTKKERKAPTPTFVDTDYEEEEEAFLQAEEENRNTVEDEDSSDDYAIGRDLAKSGKKNKKGKQSITTAKKRRQEQKLCSGDENKKRGRGRPRKIQPDSEPSQKGSNSKPVRPLKIKKETPLWRRHVNKINKWATPTPCFSPYHSSQSPIVWDDVVDLSSPLHVHAFSTLLTLQVRLQIPPLLEQELGDMEYSPITNSCI